MIRSKQQLLNNETTGIVRHASDIEKKYNRDCKTILICPKVHQDIADYFQYQVNGKHNKIIAISIKQFISLLKNSKTVDDFNTNFNLILNSLSKDESVDLHDYLIKVNNY
mgnify:CR=1 FL=1